MEKSERDSKLRKLVHDIKNNIGIMSGYAQCNYLMKRDFDLSSMPKDEILKHYLEALENCKTIYKNSEIADATLSELRDMIYKELGIKNPTPKI